MKRRVRVVCGPEAAAGFALAGLEPIVVASAAEADDRIDGLADAGVILVQEEFAPDPRSGARRAHTPLPMIVPFPGPSFQAEPGDAAAYVAEILRRAVGYRVRLE